MGVRANAMALIMLMMASMLTFPVASAEDSGRDASIVLTVSPTTLEVNPGESGEYTVTVRNLGSDPVSVQLSAANAQECQGYTTTITQIPGQIEAGSSEEASMNVTLAQNAEGECDTTVTAVANEQTTPPDPPGQPAQEEATVTTTAGDGSGNALYGVEVEIDAPSLTYNGESVTEWTGTVTSTGQAQGTNVQLSIERRNGPDCDNDGGMNPEVTPSTMENMAPDSEEDFTITTQVTDGMRATKDCWTLVAEVTNPSQEPASDSAEFDLTVPEVKDCAASVGSTLRLDPGEMGTTNVMIGNEGNTEFTAYIAFSGDARDWVEVDGTRSGLVEYDGTRTFQLEVTPPSPATVAAGEEVTADVVVRDTSSSGPILCESVLRVTVGEERSASGQLTRSLLSQIEPGTTTTTTLRVSNTGNGQETFRISSGTVPSGWVVSLDPTTTTLNGRFSSSGTDQADVSVAVTVPSEALATDTVQIPLIISSSTGARTYDTSTLGVTVRELFGMEASTVVEQQRGREDAEVRFPIEIENTGNTRDTYRFRVTSQTTSPSWATSFQGEDGVSRTEFTLDPGATMIVDHVVRIEGEERLDATTTTVSVTSRGNTSITQEFEFTAWMDDRNYSMGLSFIEPGLDPTTSSASLPPGGTIDIDVWLENTGSADDDALISIEGLDGLASRSLTIDGSEVNAPIRVPKGLGVWDDESGAWVTDASGTPYTSTDEGALIPYLGEGRSILPLRLKVTISIAVFPTSENGDFGLLTVTARSVNNTADISGQLDVLVDVRTEREIVMEVVGSASGSVVFPARYTFEVNVTNLGNVEDEVRLFTSDGLRGWSATISVADSNLTETCRVRNGDELLCTLGVGEMVPLRVDVRSPSEASLDDRFDLTLSAEPVDVGTPGRVNLPLSVSGSVDEGLLPAPGLALVVVTLLGAAIVARRDD